MMTRGERIKRARRLRRMSQLDLAIATGVGQRTIGRIERGERDNATDWEALENLEKLETYLGITQPAARDDEPTGEPAPTPPEAPIKQFSLTELLAEALSRVAAFESRTGEHITGHEPPRRIRWATEDAPTVRRDPDHPDRGVSGTQ